MPTRSFMLSSTICRSTRRRIGIGRRTSARRSCGVLVRPIRMIASSSPIAMRSRSPTAAESVATTGLSRRLVAFWCVNYFFRLNLRNDEHDHRLGPRLVTMNNLKSPQLLREIPLRFSQREFLRPLSAAVASNRASRRLGKFIWPTIFWDAAWHFTAIGDVDMINLKLSSGSHAGEYADFTEEDLQHRQSMLTKVPWVELPETIRQDKFGHLWRNICWSRPLAGPRTTAARAMRKSRLFRELKEAGSTALFRSSRRLGVFVQVSLIVHA